MSEQNADPASSEGADAISDKTVQDAVIAMVRRGFEREGRTTFDPSWRPDEDDLDSMRAALTAVWPAARDAEAAALRAALEKIAHGWGGTIVGGIAQQALADLKAPTP